MPIDYSTCQLPLEEPNGNTWQKVIKLLRRHYQQPASPLWPEAK